MEYRITKTFVLFVHHQSFIMITKNVSRLQKFYYVNFAESQRLIQSMYQQVDAASTVRGEPADEALLQLVPGDRLHVDEEQVGRLVSLAPALVVECPHRLAVNIALDQEI